MVPVPKSANPIKPGHLRPVALTSHLMKTMERIILRHIRTHVRTMLDPLQFAYCHRMGVVIEVIYSLHRTITNLENTGRTVGLVFFDLSSDFNTIQPALLRGKLGICSTTLLTCVNATTYI